MLRTPVLVQRVGEVRMKVWRVDPSRAASGITFRHRRRGDCCNCAGILAEVARKHTAAVLSRGKLCVPLQMIHCDSGTSEAFLLELRPLAETCASRQCHTLASKSVDLCLRSPKLRPTSCIDEITQDDNCELERVRRSYEQIIKDLMKNISSKNCDHKGHIDKSGMVDLCLKNNVSTERIVSLLNGFECNKDFECQEEYECNNESECDEEFEEEDIPNKCPNCMESEQNQQSITYDCDKECKDVSYSSCTGLRTKNFKIVRSSSKNDVRSCIDNGIDCSRPISPCSSYLTDNHETRPIPMYKTVRANNCRNQQSDFNSDIKEIKMTLNNIVTALSSNDACNDKSEKIPLMNKNKNECKEKKALNVDDILNIILRHVSQCKCDPSGECNDMEMMDNSDKCDSQEYLYNEGQEKYITVIDDHNDKIYYNLPSKIPLMKNRNKMSTGPSFEKNKSSRSLATNLEIQHNTEKNSLQIKETPPALVEYLRTLLPQDSREGVTHIHYYAQNDSGLLIARTPELNEGLSPPEKYSKKGQEIITNDVEDCKENLSKGYSHIIIDINNQVSSDGKTVEEKEKLVKKETKLGSKV